MPRARNVSDMRVWLSHWEWGCCGEPFEVGETVTLGVTHQIGDWLNSTLGSELAGTIDGVEMHHEEEPPPQLTGVVRKIESVRRNREGSAPMPGSVLLSPAVRVPRPISDAEDPPHGGSPLGYLVDIDVAPRPA